MVCFASLTSSDLAFAEETLNHAPIVEFTAMIKALLALKYLREVEPKEEGAPVDEPVGPELSERARKFAAEQCGLLATHAIEFCNDTQRPIDLKGPLREAFSTISKPLRRQCVVRGLNNILSEFRETPIGDLETHHDFAFVSSGSHDFVDLCLLEDSSWHTKTRPDIIDLAFGRGPKMTPESMSLTRDPPDESCMEEFKSDRISWADVTHCWKLEVSKTLEKGSLARLDERYNIEDASSVFGGRGPVNDPELPECSVSRSEALQQRWKGLKRRYEDTSEDESNSSMDYPNGKKRKTEEERLESDLPSEMQCGLYGFQLLRSAWDRTHSIVILLIDNRLSFQWHDCQGCIATSSIDVVAQLPLLVIMVLLFQRLGARMRGRAGWALEGIVDGVKVNYSVPEAAVSGRGLSGRWLIATAPLVQAPSSLGGATDDGNAEDIQIQLKLSEDLFFKLSWREEDRLDEALIVRTAKERAKYYLGDHDGDVLNHVPDIKHSENHPRYSTSIVREFVGISKNGARLPSFMLVQKLHSLDAVKPTDIVARMWEIIRCHYLLWQIGVAHGDISYRNLMVRNTDTGAYGVVNDFDLATIMTPGQASPTKQGFERTGTKPFMAILLLEVKPGRVIQRRCAHDLESVIWCFAWYVLLGIVDWQEGTYRQVGNMKREWVAHARHEGLPTEHRKGTEHLWTPLTKAALQWSYRQDLVLNGDLEYSDKTNMELINSWLPCSKRPDGEEWDWMDFEVKEEDITKGDRVFVETE